MSDWLFKKVHWLAACLSVAVLFGLIALAANIEIKDVDLWLHLAVGKHIIQSFSVPTADFLSCTVNGAPWINHEWLFQIIVYAVNCLGGIDGLLTFKVLVVFLTFVALLYLGSINELRVSTLIVLSLVLLVYQVRLTLRPDIFSLLFFTAYIFVLGMHLDKRWALWTVGIIQIVWTNLHGFFVIGPVISLIALIGEILKRKVKLPLEWNASGRLTDYEFKNLKILTGIAILACFVNPAFLKGAWYPFSVLLSLQGESRVFFDQILELQRPLSWATAFAWQPYPQFKLLILVSAISFVLNYRKIDISMLMIWSLFFLFSLVALRNIVFFAFAAYFAFLANTLDISFTDFVPKGFRNDRWRAVWSAVLAGFFIVWAIDYGGKSTLRGYYDFDRNERKSEYGGMSLRNFPIKAADFLVKNKITGNFFNDFNSGAYLLGRTFPNIKVFIDGRTEVYGGRFYERYRNIWEGDKQSFDEAVRQFKLTGAFLGYVYVPAPSKTVRHLYLSPEWVLVYFDYDAAVFLRNLPENREWIERFRIDLTKWQVPALDMEKIGPTKATPYRHINRAHALFHMGLGEKAKQESIEALRLEPYNEGVSEILKKIESL